MTDEQDDVTGDPPMADGMNDAERRFADRLADDLERVFGAGVVIDDLDVAADGRARIHATVLVEGRVESIEVEAASLLELYGPLVRRAAELRLAGAWWRIVGPT